MASVGEGQRELHLLPWLIAAILTFGVAWNTAVGPILFTVSSTHGVHLGDVAVGLVAADWAALETARQRRHRARGGQ